jgi:hypothetical protein
MDGFEAYQIYNALKLHFTSNYDAVKYNFRTSAKRDTFERRRDRYFFEKLSRRLDKEKLIHFYTANLIRDPGVWVGNMSDKVHNEYIARHDKLTYMLTQDMNLMADRGYTFDQICTTSDNFSSNPLLEALRAAEISPESVVLVDILVNFLNRLKSDLSDPLDINKDSIDLLLSYKAIMIRSSIPHDKLKQKLVSIFTNNVLAI